LKSKTVKLGTDNRCGSMNLHSQVERRPATSSEALARSS